MNPTCSICRNHNVAGARYCGRCGAPLESRAPAQPEEGRRRFVLRQKFWSWGDDYVIRHANGRDAYQVDGQAFSFGENLSFQDGTGRELASIRQRLLSWGPTYEIVRHGQVAAVVKKKLFTFFRCEFLVDLPGPDDLVADGDFLHHEYTFTRRRRPVARVSKRWFTFTDTYGVEVEPGEDEILVLASTVVVDLVCHDQAKT